MATITSVDLYLGLSSAKSGFDVSVEVFSLGSYSNDPDVGSSLGSKAIDVSNIPLISGVGPDWVRFTFDTPLTVSSSDFAGIVFDSLGSNFNSTAIRHFHAQDYSYYTTGSKDGTERCYISLTGNWVDQGAGQCLCYRINGTGITQNVADNPSGDYEALAGSQHGFRAYVDGLGSPAKATVPVPADDATAISTNLGSLSWTEGVGAVTENLYFGTVGNMENVAILITGGTYNISDYLPLTLNTEYEWRIDSVNEVSTTTGDVWSFTTLAVVPPSPTSSATIKRLCAVAENRFWYEGI